MGTIDKNRIIAISDMERSIPIEWGVAANDIKYNNAIAMAVVIARTIDKANLWNGLLHFREKFGYFKIDETKLTISGINAELNLQLPQVEQIHFTEQATYKDFAILPTPLITLPLSAVLPDLCIQVYALDATTIIIEMANPIYSENIEQNIGAFKVTAAIKGVPNYELNISSIAFNNSCSEIILTTEDFSSAAGEINVAQNPDLGGNLINNTSATSVKGFNKSFVYTAELKGE